MMRLCPKDGIKTEQERCPECGTATLVLAQNPEMRLTEGTEINGRYRIDKMIGQGGFGAVYRATSMATDQEMAIKLLAVSLDSDESDLIQRFYAEAQITASLKHPNTIRVFDFGQTEGGALYIAMELLSGQDLNDILKERKKEGKVFTEQETISFASQTLRSLAEAHMAGLVHRDLKPHNIFLNEVPGDDPVVKVLDFGIAKRLGSNLTGTGQAFGTPSYMSPEQAQNRPVDARSDIYSLGVVMYQCLTGRCPFEGDNPLAVLLSHVTDKPPDIRDHARTPLSDEMADLIHKTLEKDPFDRFEDAISMRKALHSIGTGVGTATMMPGGTPTGGVALEGGTPSRTESFASTDHGKQLVVALDIGGDDATQAYNIGPEGVQDGGSGFTEGFMLAGKELDSAAGSTASNQTASVAPKSSKAPIFAVLGVLIVLGIGGAAFVMSGGEAAPATGASSAADHVAADQTGGEKNAQDRGEQAAARDDDKANTADKGADSGGNSASEQADDKPADPGAGGNVAPDAGAPAVAAAPAAVEVELLTEPASAVVMLGDTIIGTTPVKLKVTPVKPLTGKLKLADHHDKEFFVLHTDAPAKTIRLNKKPVAVAKRPRTVRPAAAPPPPPPSKPKPDPPVRSALEERL